MSSVGAQCLGRDGTNHAGTCACGDIAMTLPDDSIVLPISGDPLLVGALLLRITAQIDDGAATTTAPSTPSETVAELRSLSPLETWRLSGMRKSGLSLIIHTRQLAANLRALRHISEEAALITYFVRHGASRAMLRALFHVSREVTARQRRRLGIHLGRGRPALPEAITRDAIHRCWASICRDETDSRKRLVQLHQQFAEYSLVALHAVIHEFRDLRA